MTWSPTSKNVNSPTMSAQGFYQQMVIVASVDSNNTATCKDRYGRYFPPISIYNIVGSGVTPEAGDVWMIDRSNGGWTFKSLVKPAGRAEMTLPRYSHFSHLAEHLPQAEEDTTTLASWKEGDPMTPEVMGAIQRVHERTVALLTALATPKKTQEVQ